MTAVSVLLVLAVLLALVSGGGLYALAPAWILLLVACLAFGREIAVSLALRSRAKRLDALLPGPSVVDRAVRRLDRGR